ncbi:MAG: capsular polysaccharide biosynthesis protein [Pseudomonadota bacterium]
MTRPDHDNWAAGDIPRRLCHVNLGFLRDRRLARILALAGTPLHAGRPRPDDAVLVWGRTPVAARGEAWARRRAVPLWRAEDAFLRSIRPGRLGDATLGLILDPTGGVHYDSSRASRLETILASDPLDNSNLLQRARDVMARMRGLHLSKYNMHDPDLPGPPPGYVLVIDQTRDDASIRHGAASSQTFRDMLVRAQEDHPTARIIIKVHPETRNGLRPGHYTPSEAKGRVQLCGDPVSPVTLLDGAIDVYTVSSQMGFEAILAGHRPRVFGQPFYAGWGLTEDENPVPRRKRNLTRTQLFAAAMILAPLWYDPCRDRLCSLEDVLDQLEAEARAFRQDRAGYVATGIRLWKRSTFQEFFGRARVVRFDDNPVRAVRAATTRHQPLMVWAGRETAALATAPRVLRIEDGFLRSRGLGAELVPPLGLVLDDLGIYYDPTRPSRFEVLMKEALPDWARARADLLAVRLKAAGLSKYNLGSKPLPPLPAGRRILVPGQVEDDASIRLGAADVRTNLDLLRAVRIANPDAVILYKPHPDVVAGLRPGTVHAQELAGLADLILPDADPAQVIDAVDAVWTMTSTLGFEALIRGKPVTCLGMPFYAGWGLTLDLAPIPRRRLHPGDSGPRPDLAHLVHAALIAYPRYRDPVSGLPCPVEVIVDRLASGASLPRGNRALSKLQGALASRAWLWRR